MRHRNNLNGTRNEPNKHSTQDSRQRHDRTANHHSFTLFKETRTEEKLSTPCRFVAIVLFASVGLFGDRW